MRAKLARSLDRIHAAAACWEGSLARIHPREYSFSWDASACRFYRLERDLRRIAHGDGFALA
eukprot:13187276-Alexandrium_andersonii.AAC.1